MNKSAGINLKFAGTVLLFLAFLFLWQNCGEISLLPKTTQDPIGSTVSPPSNPSHLAVPDVPDMEMRAVFLVDMSSSMSLAECAESIDMVYNEDSQYTTNPPTNYAFQPCDRRVGSDPKLLRLQAMDKWMAEIETFLSSRNLPASRFKAILIPFAGIPATGIGSQDISKVNPRIDPIIGDDRIFNLNRRTFSTITEIKKSIEDLKAFSLGVVDPEPPSSGLPAPSEYAAYGITDNTVLLAHSATPHAINLMTTSVPGARIEDATNIILTELRDLQGKKNRGEITDARFEVVFLSDGIPKPRKDHVKKAISKLWEAKQVSRENGCWETRNCSFNQTDFTAGGLNCLASCGVQTAALIDSGTLPEYSGTCPRQCLEAVLDYRSTPSGELGNNTTNAQPESLLETIKNYWGDYAANDIVRIMLKVRFMESVFDLYPWVNYRLNFFRVENPDPRFRYWFLDYIAEGNWMLKAREVFTANHRHGDIVSRDVPSLFPGMSPAEAYRLSFLYAINLNARVNANGVLEADSDGDGLSDYEEDQISAQGYDKTKARSDGMCLDVIRFRFGICENVGCMIEVDKDGDGLNECEEKTIGTNDYDVDTDGDGILDSHELLFGLSPVVSDIDQDYDGDGKSNLYNFRLGLGPWLRADTVAANKQIRLSLKVVGDESVTLPGGGQALVPLYTLQVLNIPSIGTEGSEKVIDLFSHRSLTPDHVYSPQILDRDLPLNNNRMQFFGRVDNAVNQGDRFWIYHEITVPFTGAQMLLDVQLQHFKAQKWSDPKELR